MQLQLRSPYRQVRIAAESRWWGYAIPMRNALGPTEHDGRGVRYTDPPIGLAGGCEQLLVASHLSVDSPMFRCWAGLSALSTYHSLDECVASAWTTSGYIRKRSKLLTHRRDSACKIFFSTVELIAFTTWPAHMDCRTVMLFLH